MHVKFFKSAADKKIRNYIFSEISNKMEKKNQENYFLYEKFFNELHKFIKNTPLSKEHGRFANKNAVLVHEFIENYPIDNPYLKKSFGNKTGLDFGTGHELNFYCALFYENFCINLFPLLKLYYKTVIFFLSKFTIEPAGSKGHWGVDDFFIIVFYVSLNERTDLKNTHDFLCKDTLLNFVVENLVSEKRAGSVTGLQLTSPFIFSFLNLDISEAKNIIKERIQRDLLESHVVMQHFIFTDKLCA